ncbi:AAA family ATPase [Sphingomonas sp. 1P06PA]|uniref:AAA family ATPase n=1 Tax=Sphingomonas sp. 1P06PA TaxID=554121 RepID=UPI0039A519C4
MTSPARSLIERAAEVFDFEAAMRARAPIAIEPDPKRVAAFSPDPIEFADEAQGTHWEGRTGTIDSDALREAGFILPDSPVGALAEEFRIVKRQLLHAATAGGAAPRDRMILVASAQPGDGKTFCAVNLALSLASERDHEVLLVDADFAKPSILSTLGLDAGPGLIDAIADPELDAEACIIRTDVGNLSVLPAGRAGHDVTERIASARTRAVLERLVAHAPHRIIVFDSSPALAASPASELAHHVGQVVLVARADRTSEADLRDAVAMLAGCETIRLLLNAVSLPSGGSRFGYYGQGDA